MVVGLLGMSGAGKSHLSQLLVKAGFLRIDCDGMIAERMCGKVAGIREPEDIGSWLGLPDTPGFAEREQQFLSYERAMLEEVLALVEASPAGRQLVVDMGGSVIYAADLLERLRNSALLIYLAITPDMYAAMLQTYLACPKPLIWQGMFQPQPGECQATAFARCYAELIAWRAARYAALSDITLSCAFYRQPGLTAEVLLQQLNAACAGAQAPKAP